MNTRDYEQESRDEAEPLVLPPNDLHAEASVLSACILDPSAVAKVADFLRPEHFYQDKHGRIFAAMLELHHEGVAIDQTTVAHRISTKQWAQRVGSPAYLAEILLASPAHLNVRKHAELVYERWRVREIIGAAQRIAAKGYVSDTSDTQAYADDAAHAISVLARKTIGAEAESNLDVLKRIVKEIQGRGVGGAPTMRGISYGLPSLDAITGGMHSGEMVYVIALTGVGKTAFAIHTTRHTLASGIGVLAFTTETTRQEFLEAMVSSLGSIDNAIFSGMSRDGRPRTPSIAEWNRMTSAMSDIAGWKHLTIDATTSPDVAYIESTALARAETAITVDKKPLGLIVVDNLHCLAAPRGLERAEKNIVLKNASERLKQLARRLGVPVLVLAQRRDAPFDKSTKTRPRPQKGELSWCRNAEQDADKVFYLHNPPLERNGKLYGEDKSRVVVIPTKVRRAAEVDIELRFVGEHGRFIDVAAESRASTSRHWVDTDADNPLTEGL